MDPVDQDEVWQYETENEDAEKSNNDEDTQSNDSDFFDHKRMG